MDVEAGRMFQVTQLARQTSMTIFAHMSNS